MPYPSGLLGPAKGLSKAHRDEFLNQGLWKWLVDREPECPFGYRVASRLVPQLLDD